MKLSILRSDGVEAEWECDDYRISGHWLILTEEYTVSELAPLPKKRDVAFFYGPRGVVVLDH